MNEDAGTIGLDELLGEEVPHPLLKTSFERAYLRDADHHRRHLPTGATEFLKTLAEKADVVAEGVPSVLYFGGGKIEQPDFNHAMATSGRIATGHKRTQAITGSGPGIMEAAHRGPTDAINGAARNVGLTLEGLVHKESPGLHNHELVTLANMSRRLELFLRLSQGGVIFPGGIGTLEEIAAVLAILLHPKNEGVHYPFVLSEREEGDGTYMRTVMKFLEQTLGDQTKQHLSVHQGFSREGLEDILALSGNKQGHWNGGLHMPSTAFHPFKLDPSHVASIDLSHPQDNPIRFLGHVRWFMNLLVQLIMIDREGDYIREHGIPVVKASQGVRDALTPVLDLVWAQGRVKTERTLNELIRFE